ncbi:MAG: CPBP family intramembrane metalloprotease [Gemmatimonadaceae bacterium]|nr:CPBP family intramembrane metalloprotease [Gemmatimonadaceae bacterium]
MTPTALARAGRLAWRVGGLVVVWVLAQGIFESFVGPLWGGVSRWIGEPIPLYPVSMLVGSAMATWVVFRHFEPMSWADLGFGPHAFGWRALLVGVVIGTVMILLTALLLWIGGWLRFEATPPLPYMVDTWNGTAWRLLVILGPAALWEELTFRGALYAAFDEAMSRQAARFASSLLFGLVHLTNPGAGVRTTLLVILAGYGLALLRERSGVPAAWGAHLAWNWVMAAVLHLPVSGLPFATPGYRATVHGPDWLTGGSWGPEGGFAAAVVLGGAAWWASRSSATHDTRTSET